ncbi:glycoside hydrolase family 17 protein [Zopfia rhizophila CBS 207.26]|uniref:Glycoside hydrolase family 17 protein n=1 Tax=Zopfia rhizophila CBS 207.26 TaxID=1314779 RepID=A0A6A6DA65_9PEZI|nr:glycoside hydrolase family 17 protein [Zopfia rhizophila CBS 207.26]
MDDVVKIFSDSIEKYADGNWNMISLVTVGNERVDEKKVTASEVVDAIHRAREALEAVGYNGPVGAVETVPAMVDSPMICENSDFALVNCHAFFDASTKAEDAGIFVKGQITQVQKACPNKRVIIMESGWPYRGDPNGLAVPSRESQKAALNSLRRSFSEDLILFSPYDSPWKDDWAGSFNSEKFWGFL